MTVKAVFFGTIGTLAETSEIQRRAFNIAFAEHDLEWIWDRESYLRMLRHPGKEARVRRYAEAAGEDVDARAVDASQERAFDAIVTREGVEARPGVRELMDEARARDVAVVFVTGTGQRQIDTILQGLDLRVEDFDWVGSPEEDAPAKPSPDLHLAALRDLGLDASEVVAIEDTPDSAAAALAAGLPTVGFPGAAARDRSFPKGVPLVERLEPRTLLEGGVASQAAE
ncbi:Beta-phosphoglucomutase [Jannaschia seosinensis]|uniref:Beta-phosphoglucomutase n=1 Tax=Jannaschia seosinensis TaxID=313367 RepID=A0A0M7B4V2_9RHOB|nr:HAD-IA family hydrolase [Jannaschia seosinensis]CUH07203.1 Beta-phosphoglucomutase [Jannaschia seosinensis]